MRRFHCTCGNPIFFENTQCVACLKEVGWCPVCATMTALEQTGEHVWRCGHETCGAALVKCHNYSVEHVCNRCCRAGDDPAAPAPLCDYCRYTETIPDLGIAGNREKWARLEAGKRRLLYTLDVMGLPYGKEEDGCSPPLSFDFKADVSPATSRRWSLGEEEEVFTGHAGGKITINIREADPVELEKSRVRFDEAHRTVIGHFRHEIAHYYWEMLVPGRCEDRFREVFGDHENPAYADAMQRYYDEGPRPDWQSSYISAYATMHPWEDFAETFAAYLDMVSVLDTARNLGVVGNIDPRQAELRDMVDRYANLGIVLNEMNRTMGLIDLVPEIFAPEIVEKMEFVHRLVRDAARPE